MTKKIKAILRAFSSLAISIVLIFTGTLSMTAFFLYLLPAFVSEPLFKEKLEIILSENLNSPVYIEKIQWNWETGISLNGICVEDDPGFSDRPLFYIDSASLDISFSDLLEKKINLKLSADQADLNLVRDKDGYTNIEQALLKIPVKKDKKPAPEDDEKSNKIKLPWEVEAYISLDNFFLYAQDQLSDKNFALKKTSFHLKIPCLSSKPVSLDFSSYPELNRREISPVSLDLVIKDLFNSDKTLNIQNIYAQLKSSIPGTNINITTSPSANKSSLTLSSNLKKLTESFSIFLPKHLSSLKTRGNINFSIEVLGNPRKDLSFNVSFQGKSLSLSGGPLKDKELSPDRINISTAGNIDVVSGRLNIKRSRIDFLNNNSLSFKGNISGLLKPSKTADLKISDLKLDIGELISEFENFIPQNRNYDLNKMSPKFTINEIIYSGALPPGNGEIIINDLYLNIPFISLANNEQNTSLSNFTLDFPEIKTSLKNAMPKTIEISALLNMDSLNIQGKNKIALEQVKIPQIRIKAKDIRIDKSAMYGLTAKADISQSLDIKKIIARKLADISDIKQSGKIICNLPAKGGPEINIPDVKLSVSKIIVQDKKHGPLKTGIDLDAKVSLIKVNSPGNIDIDKAEFNISFDKFISLNAETGVKNTGTDFLGSKGAAQINLAKIPKNILSRIPLKFKAKGKTDFGWNFIGRVPKKNEIDRLTSSASFKLEKDLSFIDTIEISLAINKAGLEIPFAKKQELKIKRISTSKPLKYIFNQKNRKGKFTGQLNLKTIEKIPYVSVKKPLNMDIAMSGSHNDLNSFKLSQDLYINPGGIKEHWEVSLYGMDHVLKRGYKKPSALWLNHIGGKSHVTLTMKSLDKLKIFANFPDVNGNMKIKTDFKLVPGKTIDSKLMLKTLDTDIKWKNMLSVKNLNTDINLERTYRLVKQGSKKYKKIKRPVFLSSEILKPGISKTGKQNYLPGSQKTNTAFQNLMGELKNRFDNKHSLSFDLLKLKSSKLPIEIRHSAADLDMNNGLPKMDFFQADILGGTVKGSFSVLENKKRFYSQLFTAFSGLDARQFLPGTQRLTDTDTELSGRFRFLIPLSTSMSSLINELEFEVFFTHIGSQFLERTIYALDPYESDENMVSMRKILKTGSPKWIKITISRGSLSLDGELEAKGVRIAIPSLDRINITGLSGIDNYEKHLLSLAPLIKALKISSEDIMIIKKNGAIQIGK